MTGLRFETLSDDAGLEVIDPVERCRYTLRTPSAVDPTPASSGRFHYPVDSAVRITTEALSLPTVISVYVRDLHGEMIAQAETGADVQLPRGQYVIDLNPPIKIYLSVDSTLEITADANGMTLSFGERTDVCVGARSFHESPTGTITTTDDPEAMMAAVSALGSALKTTSPERSFPTLRGHPPLLELGNKLQVPDRLERPDTGVRLELPSTYRHIYVATPLAFYLGAEVVPGEQPRVVTEDGFEHELDTVRGFEAEVERVLKQVFFLDCVTRIEGYYSVDLHERNRIESLVDLDFADLYDRSIPEQLERYFEVPYPVLEDHVPTWGLTMDVRPKPDHVEMLPFAANDLAVVRTPQPVSTSHSPQQAAAIHEFKRSGDFTRTTSGASPDLRSYVQPTSADALEQAWVGEGTPIHATKSLPEAYYNRLEREPVDGDIRITVVCNDGEMGDERDAVDEAYGARNELPFDISVHRHLSTDELRRVMADRTEFFHYIGHIDEDGFECSDGKLDARTLDAVGTQAFLLNACTSYKQGLELVRAGSVGGVVTLSDIGNTGASRIGRTFARLLNNGFPLHGALDVAGKESLSSGQYVIVGDGMLPIAQHSCGMAHLCEVNTGSDQLEVTFHTYPPKNRIGGIFTPPCERGETTFLYSGRTKRYHLTKSDLLDALDVREIPVLLDEKITWSSNLSRPDFD
jgi:hypothetical protein